MNTYFFFYNIILIILYSVTLALTAFMFKMKQKKLYLILTILLSLFTLDTVIIFTTEFFEQFAVQYNMLFLTAPAFKTILIIPTSICYLYLVTLLLEKPLSETNYLPVILHILILMFTPVIQDQALQVYLYYLPSQVYLISLCLYAHKQIKAKSVHFDDPFYRHILKALKIVMILSLFIAIEDTFVIFNLDSYNRNWIEINNRNMFEDFLRVFLCYTMIQSITSFEKVESLVTREQPTEAIKQRIASTTKHATQLSAISDISSTEPIISKQKSMDPTFEQFCSHYHLSERERELLHLILQNKTNQEISDDLFISLGTVKTHIHNIYQKVGVTKRALLISHYYTFTDTNQLVV